MSALGSLVVKLALEHAQFNAGADAAKQRADALAKQVQDSMDGMASTIKSTAAGIAGGLAAAFTIGAVDQLLKDVTASQAALNDLSHMAGMTVESLSALQSVGRYVGLGAQEIAEASVSMTDALAQAKDESDGVGQALAAIGLKFEDFRSLKPDEQFKVLARALSEYEDGAGKAAVMTQIMGEEGAKLLPFLRDLAEAGELQAEVTQAQIEAATEYQANLVATQAAAEAWKQEIAAGMVPALNLAVQAFDEVINSAGGLLQEAQALGADGSIQQWTEGAITGLSYVADAAHVAWRVLETVGKNLGGLAAAIVMAVQGDFQGAWEVLKITGQDMIDVWDDPTIGARFRENMDKIKSSAQQATPVIEKKTLAVKNYGEAASAAAERQKQLDKAAQDAAKAAQRELEAETAARVKAYGEEVKAQEARLKAYQSAADRAEQAVQDARDEEEAYARAAAQGISLAEAVAQIGIARAEEAYQQALNRGEDAETLLAIHREIEARKQLLQILGQRVVREANAEAQTELKRQWDRTAQTVGQTLSDYIMGGGKDAATYLKRLFATLVLQPVVQTVVGGVLGTGTGVGGASAVGGGLNLVQTGKGLWDAFSGGLTGTLGTQIASLGATLGTTAATAFGSGIVAGGNLGLFGGGIGQGLSMIGSGAAGSTAAGLGTIAGAAMPWVAGGLAVLSLFSSGAFSSRGANHVGGAYSSEGLTDSEIMASLGFKLSSNKAQDVTKRSNAELDKSVAGLASGLLGAYNQLATVLGGSKAQINAAFAINPKYDDEKSYGYFQLRDEIGNLLVDYDNRKLSKDHDEAWEQYANDMANAFVGQLRESDITGWADDILDGLGDSVTVEGFAAAAQQIAVIDAAFESWAATLVGFKDLSDEAQTALVRAFGSFEAMATGLNSWYASYYSEQERYEQSLQQMRSVLADLDLSIDPAMGERAKLHFRATAEAALQAGNEVLYAQMVQISGSFAQLADYAQAAAEAAAKAAEDAVRAAVDRAMTQLEYSIGRERDYWSGIASKASEAVSSLSSAVNLLQSNASDLYSSVDSAAQMQAVQGMLYVENALAAVKRGASVLEFDKLQEAITAARGGINEGNYASAFERERDALVLAGQLSQLGELTDAQLSVEERALKAAQQQIEQLDKTLDYWQQQIDGTQAGINATLSVQAAVNGLSSALQAQAAAQAAAAAAAAAASSGGYSGGSGLSSPINEWGAHTGIGDSGYRLEGNTLYFPGGGSHSVQSSSDVHALVDAYGLVLGPDGTYIRTRARGGYTPPGLTLVGEEGPELVNFRAPSMVYTAAQTANLLGMGGNTERLETLVEQQTRVIADLSARLAAIERNTRKTAQVLVDVTDDGNAMVTHGLEAL